MRGNLFRRKRHAAHGTNRANSFKVAALWQKHHFEQLHHDREERLMGLHGDGMTKQLSLRAKMILGGTLILLVPVVVIGVVTFMHSSRVSEESAKMKSVQIAESLSGMVQIAIKKDLGIVIEMSKDPRIIEGLLRGKKPQIREKITDLYKLLKLNYESIGVYDRAGIIYCDAVDVSREGIEIYERPYFEAAKEGKTEVDTVVVSRVTNAPIFALSAPVLSSEGEFLGGVVGVVKVDFLIRLISSIDIGRTGYAFMLDREGVVIAHPDKEKILHSEIYEDPSFEEIVNEIKHHSTGASEYTYHGKRKICGFAPVKIAGWTLVVSQQKEEIMSLAYENIHFILMISGAFTFFTILMVYVFSGRISTPVQSKLTYLSQALEQAMEETQAGVWESSPETRTIHLSPQWYAMLGYPPQEKEVTLEEAMGSFSHPEDRSAVEEYLEDYIRSGGQGQYELEVRLRRADGTWCWILSKARAVEWSKNGTPSRIVGLDINIQNIKDTQIRLSESEARFRALFRMAPLPLAEVTRERFIQVNDRFSTTLGYTLDDLPTLDHWWKSAYPDPDYRWYVMETWYAKVDRALREGTDVPPDEYHVTGKDGVVHNMIVGASVVHDNMLLNLFDITDLRRNEADRIQSLELLRTTFNATPDGILVLDHELNVTQANRQFYEMWHLPKDLQMTDNEAVLWEFILDQLEDPAGFQNMVERINHSRMYEVHEIPFKDGKVFECYSAPMVLNEDVVGRVWDFRDISKQKQAEAERERLQQQLLQAQKLEAVGILAGGVAHDFNNILGTIIGYAELTMERMDAGDPSRENLAKILDAAQRSAALTRQLLTFARKQTVTPMVLDLNKSVESVFKMLRRLIGENIELVWQPGETPCIVKMDPSQLDQILANLCVNARDAIENVGQVTIQTDTVDFDDATCRSYVDCAPGTYVRLTVADNGSGMDEETLKHVFEPFFTTKGLGRGTGLGLATIYGIVKQNKGFISLYSEPEIGTTFNIFIPVHAGEAVQEQAEAVDHIPRGRGETVLMVEDDSTLMEIGRMMLERLGYEVLSASTPGEAIQLARERSGEIHLFLSDVVMPEMNGRELIDRLLEIRPGVKHLFMSGYTADVVIHRGVVDDGINFIQKPFSVKNIAVKVREVLDTSEE
jgi:PAS domain S-box-containing protein